MILSSTETFRLRWHYLKSESNVEAHRRWFEKLDSNAFYDNVTKSYNQDRNKNTFRAVARRVIDEEIYKKWPEPDETGEQRGIPSGRTGRLLESFKVAVDSDEAGFTTYSDPSVATAKGDSSWSYAAFFERPEFHSFLPPKEGPPTDIRKHRPFMTPLVNALRLVSEEVAMDALHKSLKKWKPKK